MIRKAMLLSAVLATLVGGVSGAAEASVGRQPNPPLKRLLLWMFGGQR
jgi:hypothetical protein